MSPIRARAAHDHPSRASTPATTRFAAVQLPRSCARCAEACPLPREHHASAWSAALNGGAPASDHHRAARRARWQTARRAPLPRTRAPMTRGSRATCSQGGKPLGSTLRDVRSAGPPPAHVGLTRNLEAVGARVGERVEQARAASFTRTVAVAFATTSGGHGVGRPTEERSPDVFRDALQLPLLVSVAHDTSRRRLRDGRRRLESADGGAEERFTSARASAGGGARHAAVPRARGEHDVNDAAARAAACGRSSARRSRGPAGSAEDAILMGPSRHQTGCWRAPAGCRSRRALASRGACCARPEALGARARAPSRRGRRTRGTRGCPQRTIASAARLGEAGRGRT